MTTRPALSGRAVWRTTVTDDGERLIALHGDIQLELSPETGWPLRLLHLPTGVDVELAGSPVVAVDWMVGGRDVPHPPVQMPPVKMPYYEGSVRHGDAVELRKWELVRAAHGATLVLISECGDWELVTRYRFAEASSRIGLGLGLVNRGAEVALLRRLRVQLDLPIAGDGWYLEVPAAALPPSLSLDAGEPTVIAEQLGVGLREIGLVGLHRPGVAGGIAVWAHSRELIAYLSIAQEREALSLEYDIAAAARLAPAEAVAYDSLYIEPLAGSWTEQLAAFQSWWPTVGVRTPTRRADWTRSPSLYELQVGTVPFVGGGTYAPVPTVRDLVAALPKIKALGFDAIQLMVRQPFPSYVGHDLRDVTTQWGEESELREFIALAHSQGVRVIFDLVIHGVLDHEMFDAVLAEVREQRRSGHGQANDLLARWLDEHEQHWRPFLVDKHPFAEEHPDWFMRREDGGVAHVYTRAFDVANREVEEYLIGACEELLERLDLDGFRMDEPDWNEFPNWDPESPRPAGSGIFAGPMFLERAYERLKAVRPDILIYTEPWGPLFRHSADANYSYDEWWVIGAVAGRELADNAPAWVRSKWEMTARQMATWFDSRQRALPEGSVTVHHVDSANSMYWCEPGAKWSRERLGRPATRAFMAAFALIDGGYQNYVGGEEGDEDFLQRLLRLRRDVPEIARGACDYLAVGCDADMVFTPLRSLGELHSVVAINLGRDDVEAALDIPVERLDLRAPSTVYDALNDEFLRAGTGRLIHSTDELGRLSVPFAPFQSRLLVLRPAATRE